MKVFYMTRNFYGRPQMLLAVADDRTEAEKVIGKKLESENYNLRSDEVIEVETTIPSFRMINLPFGDPNFR